jgi:uncharacterized membrane protein YphA (DoxX/SURF4 family)
MICRRHPPPTPAEARTDYAMLLGSVFLFLIGAGPVSVDGRIWRSKERNG